MRHNHRLSSFATLVLAVLVLAAHSPVVAAHQPQSNDQMSTQTIWIKRQLRATWIATVTNINWPSSPGLSISQQQQELIRLLDASKQMGMNAVILQIRPTADAFYASTINPWSKYLTGTAGKNPGYDPLAFAIAAAHERNLEFHAWFNPYRVSMDTKLSGLASTSWARLNPQYVVSYGGKLWYDPGHPAVRKHVVDSIVEVVRNYDIDAVHFDDYFYPYPSGTTDFPDTTTYQTYGASQFPVKADWRRSNVNTLVREVSTAIKQTKNYVKFGISPFGIWRNRSTDPTGSDTSGFQAYDGIYADARTWIRQGWLDYIAPQIYWSFGYAPAAYEKLVSWWSNEVRGYRVKLYIGHAAYKIGNDTAAWNNPDELPNQLAYNLQFPETMGSMLYNVNSVIANPLGLRDRLTNDIWRYPALIDPYPWLDSTAPTAPNTVAATRSANGVKIDWTSTASDDTAFAVYRFSQGEPVNLADPAKILVVQRATTATTQTFLDTRAPTGTAYTYVVTALDRLHNESAASNALTVPTK